MNMISKEQFISAIESMRVQTALDYNNSYQIGKIFGCDAVGGYNNSLLIKSIISLLWNYFPKRDGFCEIEHYCFDLNFGKNGEEELITPEDLWNRLISEPEEEQGLYAKRDISTDFSSIWNNKKSQHLSDFRTNKIQELPKFFHVDLPSGGSFVFSMRNDKPQILDFTFPVEDNGCKRVEFPLKPSSPDIVPNLIEEVGQYPRHKGDNILNLDWDTHKLISPFFLDEVIEYQGKSGSMLTPKIPSILHHGRFTIDFFDPLNQFKENSFLHNIMKESNSAAIKVSNITEINWLIPKYPYLDDLRHLFDLDKNHSEFIGYEFTSKRGWTVGFVHPEGRKIHDFQSIFDNYYSGNGLTVVQGLFPYKVKTYERN